MSYMTDVKDELNREKERIIMTLETERQLDIILGETMKALALAKYDDLRRKVNGLTTEEAKTVAHAITQNLEPIIDKVRSMTSR